MLVRAKAPLRISFAGGGTDQTKYAVAEPERLQAGFDSDEVEIAARMSRDRRKQGPPARP